MEPILTCVYYLIFDSKNSKKSVYRLLFRDPVVQKITGHKNVKSYFIIELPDYKFPNLLYSAKSMLQRGCAFIVKAGTIILVCNAAVFLMSNFNWSLQMIVDEEGAVVLFLAIRYIYKAKKKGVKCIGCPQGNNCSHNCNCGK